MSDSAAPAPSANDTAESHLPQSIREMADALPSDAFGPGFGDDEEQKRPGEAPPDKEARAPREEAEDPARPAAPERRRGPDGKFAPADQGEQADEAYQEPQEGTQEADQGEVAAGEAPEPHEGEEAADEAAKDKDKGPSLYMEIDGRRYSAEDIHRGFLRNEDYTRKTQEVARERQHVQAQAQQAQAYEQQLGTLLDITVQALRDTLPPQPTPDMIDQDIVGYHKQLAAHNAAVERLQAIAGQRDQMGNRTAAQQQAFIEQQNAATQQALQREFAQMQEKIPELRTPEGRDTFFREAQTHGAYYGLTPEDIGAIQDHRALRVLKDAIAYRKLQAAKPQTVERLKAAPPIRPQARPGPGTRQGQAKREATERFTREPSIKTALATGIMDDIFGT